MLMEIGGLAAGIVVGRLLKDRVFLRAPVAKVAMLTLGALMMVIGAGLGGDATLFASIGIFGLQALVLGTLCTLGSAACARLAQGLFKRRMNNAAEDAPGGGSLLRSMKGSLILLGCFTAGLLLARFGLLPPLFYSGPVTNGLLYTVLFLIGLGIGFNLGALRVVREIGLRALFIPLLSMIGALAGAALACSLLSLDLRSCLVIGSAVGYYSLGSVLAVQGGGAALGAVLLLANIVREMLCLVCTPLIARVFGPVGAVAAAGMPGMSTCLPVVTCFTGPRYAILSLFSGVTLALLVPVIIPLLFAI
ncbi:MAG: lysine exporter LysO family protein [Deltaproteobacteria bacterium]|jgi:uncharacterized membrane protein YbjE (DUF340 family)|nr:lysine exporter LysO family protein [Deltaproteobacteria bacterium]